MMEPVSAVGRTCGCGANSGDVTQIDILGNGVTIGIVGLRQIFQEHYALGFRPGDPIGGRLLAAVAARNYVHRSVEEAYQTALLREYAAFCAGKEDEGH